VWSSAEVTGDDEGSDDDEDEFDQRQQGNAGGATLGAHLDAMRVSSIGCEEEEGWKRCVRPVCFMFHPASGCCKDAMH
jgi:hypothetical protein